MEKYKKWKLAGKILIPIGIALLLIFGIPFLLGTFGVVEKDGIARIFAYVGIFGGLEIGLAAIITGGCLLGLGIKHLKSPTTHKK